MIHGEAHVSFTRIPPPASRGTWSPVRAAAAPSVLRSPDCVFRGIRASVPRLELLSGRSHLPTARTLSPVAARGQVVHVSTSRASVRAIADAHRLTSKSSSALGLCAATVAHVGHDGRDSADVAHVSYDILGQTTATTATSATEDTPVTTATTATRLPGYLTSSTTALGAVASRTHIAPVPLEMLRCTSVAASYKDLNTHRSSRPSLSARAREQTPRPRLSARATQTPPASTRRSADVKVSEGGSGLQLRVHILPSELVRWKDLQVCACIDTASFGEVMLARHGNQVVAAKRCLAGADGSMTKEQMHNFEREINAYRILKHPGVVGYVGCVLDPPNLAVLTEYLPKGNVFSLLYMNRVNLPAAIRLKISQQLTEVVDFMHGLDPVLAHLDLKTSNILLDADCNAKLCDFGKTHSLEHGFSVVQGSELLGSPRYMAPELFNGPGTRFTEKADIWGLGCCLIEILGGPIPFEDVPEVAQIMDCLRRGRPPLVPHWFAEATQPALRQCFAFEPERRPAAAGLAFALGTLTAQDMERCGMDKRRTS